MSFRLSLNDIREYRRRRVRKSLQEKVENRNVSIFCNNCVGGVIAHDLGLRFNSPTVNLYISPQDYVKFALRPEYYLGLKEVLPIEGFADYPIGILDDITLHFVHYESLEDARSAWLRRASRVNLDNSCWILVDRDGLDYDTAQSFDSGVDSPHVILTGRSCFQRIRSVIYRDEWRSPSEDTLDLCAFRSCVSGARHIDSFDYVSLINKAAAWHKRTIE